MLVNDRISLDAGSLGLAPLAIQERVGSVLLTHSHLDHIATLPIFLDNRLSSNSACPQVFAHPTVLESLRAHVFNNTVWPDLVDQPGTPDFVHLEELSNRQTLHLEGLEITPVELSHVLPTFGFVVRDSEGSVGFVTDTSPTEEVWKTLNAEDNLRAVFLETSFPARMEWLAKKAGHLTPQMMAAELEKLDRSVPVYIVHLKAAFRSEVEQEIRALGLADTQIVVPEREYYL